MYFECTAAAGGWASKGSGGKSEVVAGGCWLLAVAEAAGHCDAFEHGLLDVASLVGSNVAAVVGGSVGGGGG